ncbi:hypothetical protein M405DRAFT_275510 [Rhizopogon salebrosus TDB-379]|nr:hypothetical protein M405DRAFT_275510 [Rhizopogon salebrosus TDB-379]
MSRNADSAQGLIAWLLACSRGPNLDEELYEKISMFVTPCNSQGSTSRFQPYNDPQDAHARNFHVTYSRGRTRLRATSTIIQLVTVGIGRLPC